MPSSSLKISANYDHIELSDQELAAVIHAAKAAKHVRLETEAYKAKLFQPPVYQQFTFDDLKKFVLSQNPDYVIDESNRVIFDLLCMYFSGDPGFEFETGYSLKKGIILFGPVGCGKTRLMKIFALNSFRPYSIVSCRVVADKYSKNGSDALEFFSGMQAVYPQQNFGHMSIGRCFDDLGTEESKKNFGNEVNVMQDIIYRIYNDDTKGNFHLTTNLSSSEIEEYYGTRVRSRCRELFNLISFNAAAPDRRK